MSNPFNKKIAEILGRMDEKVLQAKLTAAMDLLAKGDTDELVRNINKLDKNELLEKINDFDESKLKDIKIDRDEIKKKISDADLNHLKTLIGEHGDEIVGKIKDIIG